MSTLPVELTVMSFVSPLAFVRVMVPFGVASPRVWKTGMALDEAVIPLREGFGDF